MPGSAYIKIGLVFPRRGFLRSDFVVVRFHLDGPLARARMSVAGRGYVRVRRTRRRAVGEVAVLRVLVLLLLVVMRRPVLMRIGMQTLSVADV